MIHTHSEVVTKSFWRAVMFASLVAMLNFGLWAFLNRPKQIDDWSGKIGGLAYNAFQRYQSPILGLYPSEQELASDIRLLSKHTKRLRTYSSAESPQVPRIAAFYDMEVMAGAWIDRRMRNNEVELEGLIALSRKHPNITRAMVEPA